MRDFRQCFVVQCKSNGKFLTSELNYCTSLSLAGRLFDRLEAHETGVFNLEMDYEVHSFFEAFPSFGKF